MMLRRSSIALGILAVLTLAACSDDPPTPAPSVSVDDGATIVPRPDPSPTYTYTPFTPLPTVFATPPPDPGIAEVVGEQLRKQDLRFTGWCFEVEPGARDVWCADRPEPQEGILVVRVGPVFSEFVYDIYVGIGDNEQWVFLGQGPVTNRIR